MGNTLAPPNEEVLWSLGLQVLAALHAVHNAGAAVNTLDPSRVLLTERGTRARISGAAVADVLRPEVQPPQMPPSVHHRPLQISRPLHIIRQVRKPLPIQQSDDLAAQ